MATTAPPTDDTPERAPFAKFLREQRKGELHDELSDEFQKLVQAVSEHGRTGKLTLTIKVTRTNDGVTVFVTDDVTATPPKPERGGSIMFPDAKGNLHRNNPDQLEFSNLKSVPVADGSVVDVDVETGEVKDISNR